jgi:2-methylcitrate dehydratase
MEKIEFRHGGPEYDAKYPDGIPTSVRINDLDSGLVMYPAGHARNVDANLQDILAHKFDMLGDIAAGSDKKAMIAALENIENLDSQDLKYLYAMPFTLRERL